MLLKGNFARKSWPIDAFVWGRFECVVGAIHLALIVASIPRRISIDLASKEATIALDRGHDQAAIGLRSRTFRLPSSMGIVRQVLEESWY